MRNETIAIHAGYDPDPTTKSVAVPIYQTVAYAFDSADHGAALFNLEAEGYRYSRIANPTTAVLEKRITELEGGVGALAVATGQAALHFALVNLADTGGNIVSVPQLYGTTHTLLAHVLPRQGITTRFADSDKADDIEKLIDENTKAIFSETIGNPAGNVCDIEALAKVAHRHGVPLVVDNTVATPILLKPFDYGADIAVHSLTKFLGGHGTTLGGAIVDSGRFPWTEHASRFPAFNEPDESYHGLVYTRQFGASAYIQRARSVYQRTMGSVLSPFNAFLLLQGIETVALRVERHVENARKVADFLRNDPRVAWVNYAGFPDSPYYALVQKYLERQRVIAVHLRHQGRPGGRQDLLRLAEADHAAGQYRRREIARLPSGFDHPPPDVCRTAADGRRSAGNHPAFDRHRTFRTTSSRTSTRRSRRPAPASAARGRGIDRRAWHDRPVRQTAADRQSRPRAGAAAGRRINSVVRNMPTWTSRSGSSTICRMRRCRRRNASSCASAELAAGDIRIDFHCFSLPSVNRSQTAKWRVDRQYTDIADLGRLQIDGLIVTGAEPNAATLPEEPFWQDLTDIIDWAETNTRSTIWSCLAAHAAVLHLDGIERQRLDTKCSGVYDCAKVTDNWLTEDVPSPLKISHSRLNELRAGDLTARGYQLLTQSRDAGVDIFAKELRSQFIFFQGHPEYDALSLEREYLRDISRFLAGERDTYPAVPAGYFDAETEERLASFQRAGERRTQALAEHRAAGPQPSAGHRGRSRLRRRSSGTGSDIFPPVQEQRRRTPTAEHSDGTVNRAPGLVCIESARQQPAGPASSPVAIATVRHRPDGQFHIRRCSQKRGHRRRSHARGVRCTRNFLYRRRPGGPVVRPLGRSQRR